MTLAEFVRIYPLRSKSIAWLFGAGTSVSAGMPTATDLIWEFKRRIYCSEESIPVSLFSNLTDQALRNQIQAYFNSKQNYPPYNSVEEYSFYFEKAFASANDRSNFLMQQLNHMQNSFGHKAIGILMKNGALPVIFTTNFDKAFENAAVEQLKRLDSFLIADLDNNATAIQKYNQGFRPIIVKIHGDYFSENLKNTTGELQAQDEKLRQVLLNSCLTNGLAVMGYSGRDSSVMEVLNTAINNIGAFSNGLFWFIRAGSEPLPEVVDLINRAKEKGIQAEFIEIDTFDTAWGEITKGFTNLPTDDISNLNANYYRTTPSVAPTGKSFPVIRLNAITIKDFPKTARLLKCNVDSCNTKELKEIVQLKKEDLLVIRKRSGIVGFGPDEVFEKVFNDKGITGKDIYNINEAVLRDEDSGLKGMLTEALLKSFCREMPFKYVKKRGTHILYPMPTAVNSEVFDQLKKDMPQLIGDIVGSKSKWIAGLEISIQLKFSTILAILKPTIIASRSPEVNDRFINAAYIKEATARWYNRKTQQLLDAWIETLFQGKNEAIISAYDPASKGFVGQFTISKDMAFSKSL